MGVTPQMINYSYNNSWGLRVRSGSWGGHLIIELCKSERKRLAAASKRGPGLNAHPLSHDVSLFRRLVLGCINTDFCVQILIFQHFSRSIESSSWILLNLQKSLWNFKFCKFLRKSATFCKNPGNSMKFCKQFTRLVLILWNLKKNQLDYSVDLGKCWKISIWMQKSVLIQPRTSYEKSDVSWLKRVMCRGWKEWCVVGDTIHVEEQVRQPVSAAWPWPRTNKARRIRKKAF